MNFNDTFLYNIKTSFPYKKVNGISFGYSEREKINLEENNSACPILRKENSLANYKLSKIAFGMFFNKKNIENENETRKFNELKEDFTVFLREIKSNKKNVYDENSINELVSKVNEENVVFLKNICSLKDDIGNFQFDKYELLDIVGKIDNNFIKNFQRFSKMRGKDGKLRFKYADLNNISKCVDESNSDHVNKLISLENNRGEYRYSGTDIYTIEKGRSDENNEIIDYLISCVDDDGDGRFTPAVINNLAEITNSDNYDIARSLINLKTENDDFRFTGSEIVEILDSVNDYNKKYVEYFADMTDINEVFRFDGTDISEIINVITTENEPFVNQIVTKKDDFSNPRFSTCEIYGLLSVVNKDNIKYLDYFIEKKTQKGDFIYDGLEIASILKVINDNNFDFIKYLADFKKQNGTPRFSGVEIANIALSYNEDKINYIEKFINMKNEFCEDRFKGAELVELITLANKKNISFIYNLLNLRDEDNYFRFNGIEVSEIAKIIPSEKFDIVKEFAFLKNAKNEYMFTGYGLATIVNSINNNNNINACRETLKTARDYTAQSFSEIVKFVNDENIGLLKELELMTTADGKTRFPSAELVKLFTVVNKNNFELIKILSAAGNGYRFSGYDIAFMAKNLKYDDLPAIQKYSFYKNDAEGYKFYGQDIVLLVKASKKIDDRFINELITAKNKKGNSLFLGYEVGELMKAFVKNFSDLSFKEKTMILKVLSYAKENISNGNENLIAKFDEMKVVFEKLSKKAITPINSSKEAKQKFFRNFLVTANEKNAEVIRKMDKKVIEKYGNVGLPLNFSREEFVKNLKRELELYPAETQNQILEKLNIVLSYGDYEGFININNFDNIVPEKIQKLCIRFLKENKIETGEADFDNLFNSIIEAFPDYINIIGKKQHKKHYYTLDMHILKVVKEVVSNKKFNSLNNKDKMLLQMLALFHDIGKKGGVIDKGHELTSAIITNDIIENLNFHKTDKKRLIELIKNHNWLEKIGLKNISLREAAVMFRSPNDLLIAEIFADSDLKAINNDFYNTYAPSLYKNVPLIKKEIDNFYKTGNMFFATKLLNINKFPDVEYNGEMYKVLNLSKLKNSANLFDYGLSINKIEDLRLMFHAGNYNVLQDLTKPFNEAVISVSMLSPKKKATYNSVKTGFWVDAVNENVINTSSVNQSSGIQRDFSGFVNLMGNNIYREFQQNMILSSLNNNRKKQLNKNDYAFLYNAILNKKYLSQIEEIKLPNGEVVTKNEFKKAYMEMEKEIMKKGDLLHNEIVLYNPTINGIISLSNSISEIPKEYLNIAKENNLPIILLGKSFKI